MRAKSLIRFAVLGTFGLLLASSLAFMTGCASGSGASIDNGKTPSNGETAGPASLIPKGPEPPAPPAEPANAAIQIDVSDTMGKDVPVRVELHRKDAPDRPPVIILEPKGRGEHRAPAGDYVAHTYLYQGKGLILADIQNITLNDAKTAYLLVSVIEDTSAGPGLLAFDQDGDHVLDRVEIDNKTNPENPLDYPGAQIVPIKNPVIDKKPGWLKGELHAHSTFGGGKETVAQLVARAERLGLDFLAITDRNTLAACSDPAFTSSSVVLIPAMEWGNEENGLALIYAPRTVPAPPGDIAIAQLVSDRVQAQGGAFAAAHPCFSLAPWRWGVSYINAIEVWWYGGWRELPPMRPEQLGQDLTERQDYRLIYSIAQAAATTGLSANGQAAVFWESELRRGLKAGIIAGSGAANPKTALATPVTYVYALEKSVAGVIDGIRRGRTMIAANPKGPRLHFVADVLNDGHIDVNIGGVIPLNVNVTLEVGAVNAKGCKLEVLRDGIPILTTLLDSDTYAQRIKELPCTNSTYYARIIEPPKEKGFGPINVLAMTSPIYAEDITQQILMAHPELDPAKAWVEVVRGANEPEAIDEWVLSPKAAAATEMKAPVLNPGQK